MLKRRACHLLFDLIKCPMWQMFFRREDFNEYDKNLILKDPYFTFEQLENLDFLEQKLNLIHDVLKRHIEDECKDCRYKG